MNDISKKLGSDSIVNLSKVGKMIKNSKLSEKDVEHIYYNATGDQLTIS